MYITLVALYLLTVVDFERINNELTYKAAGMDVKYMPLYDKYTDFKYNTIDSNYCGEKTCLIKCCADNAYLDYDGNCYAEKLFIYRAFGTHELSKEVRDIWHKLSKQIGDHKNRLSEHFVFIRRVSNYTRTERNFTTEDSYMFQSGDLYYQLNDPPHFNLEWPLHHCADFRLDVLNIKKEERVKLVFDLSDIHEELPQEDINTPNVHIEYYVVGGGLLFTILSILISTCRLQKLLREGFMLFSFLVYIFSLICAYTLKMMHMGVLNTRLYERDDCRAVSASLYFLLLSSFCWSIILNYDALKALRKCRLTKKFKIEMDIVAFFRYAMFAWGLPLLLTVLALAADKLNLDFETPPFSNCFGNAKQTMLYLHIPVSMLINASTTIFLIYSYDMWLFIRIIEDKPNIEKSKKRGLRTFAIKKLISLLLIFIVIQNIPDMPLLLYYTINVCIIVSGITCVFLFISHIILIMMLKCKSDNGGEEYKVLQEATFDPTHANKIAIISNNELDKKKTLYFTNNIALVKDHIMASIISHDYEKLLDGQNIDNNENHDAENCENIVTDDSLQINDNVTSNKCIEKY